MTPTATAEPTDSAAAQEQKVVYPISPDYVSKWTTERAIAELVSNAIDEDPSFSFDWKDGVLTIEDNGPGIPQEGLVLGWSNKTDEQIGMWGEGAKLACLVLARDENIGNIRFETVGFGFVPSIELTTFGGIPGADQSAGTEMLHCTFFPHDRECGTRITIECDQQLALDVSSRFRKLSEEGYEASNHDRIITTGPGGRLYIAGVLINDENRNLRFSYDFSLENAKHLQNRDRTVIAGYQLDGLIMNAWRECRDAELQIQRVKLALDGQLGERSAETNFNINSPDERLMFWDIGKKIFGDEDVVYADRNHEALLDLEDRDIKILRPKKMDQYRFESLMKALGVSSASSRFTKPKRQTVTDWIQRSELTVSQTEILDRAVELVRRAFGVDAVDTVKIYRSTRYEGADSELRFGGFYQPTGKGLIGLHVDNLKDLQSTLEVLVHEAAHRLRHRSHQWDWHDRTRGFERQLGDMAAAVLMQISDEDLPTIEQLESDLEAQKSTVTTKFKNDILFPALQQNGIHSARELAEKTGLTTGVARSLYNIYNPNRPRKYRLPNPQTIQVVSDQIGINEGLITIMCFGDAEDTTPKLTRGGYTHRIANRLRSAIEKMREENFDASVCDRLLEAVNKTDREELDACMIILYEQLTA